MAQADSKFTDEIQQQYSSINIPTLILWGQQDEWIPIEKGRELNEVIPGSKLCIIPESGHLVIEEKPEKLVEEIQAFLRE